MDPTVCRRVLGDQMDGTEGAGPLGLQGWRHPPTRRGMGEGASGGVGSRNLESRAAVGNW